MEIKNKKLRELREKPKQLINTLHYSTSKKKDFLDWKVVQAYAKDTLNSRELTLSLCPRYTPFYTPSRVLNATKL